jgi:hypothetical protein
MKFILSCLLISTAYLGARTGLDLDDVKSAEAHRQKTLQNLHVAQAPLHTKQEKATEAEITKYKEAVIEAVAFQRWIAYNGKRSLFIKETGNNSTDPLNRIKFSKYIWEVHDAKVNVTPPFSRNDIGIAVKMMNDARELFQLPISISRGSMPKRQ